jgi:pimeloyl-ACP methyl ester carboxylesterase
MVAMKRSSTLWGLFALVALFGSATHGQKPTPTPTQVALEDRFFTSGGIRLRYVDVGSGEPVVLVHGAGNSIEFPWRDRGIIAALAETHRVIAYDARGHGKSDNPPEPEQYTFENTTADLAALLDHVGVVKAHVVGYSLGARSVMALMLTHSERFLTGTLIASEWFFRWNDAEAARVTREVAELGTTRTVVCIASPVTRDCANVLRQIGIRISRQSSVLSATSVKAITVPILGIVGTDDPNVGPMRELKSMKPEIAYLEVAGATLGGDMGILARSETLATLKRFLATNRQPN